VIKTIATPLLDIAFDCGGPADGEPVMLLHGWPDDATGWKGVTPSLERAGFRWVAPWLRGFGGTRFRDDRTVRDGTAVAIAHDAMELADVLQWDQFSVVGHDWGGRAAYIMAAIAPARMKSITSLAIGYAPGGRFEIPSSFSQSHRWWYQWFMTTEGGAAAVRADPVGFARCQWETWSPTGWFEEAAFQEASKSFRSADWVDITLNGYRTRWCQEKTDPLYNAYRTLLAGTEIVNVPTLMVQGADDRCDPPEESERDGRFFAAAYRREILKGVGHFPAREDPEAVGDLIIAHLSSNR
jgi:pimeloyl-ACP methyl ester carboxylesterase